MNTDELKLPALMAGLEHPTWGLILMSLWPQDNTLHEAPEGARPEDILRVECWIEAGNQYLYTYRESSKRPWSPVFWGEHSDMVQADTEVRDLDEAMRGIDPETPWGQIHPALRGP